MQVLTPFVGFEKWVALVWELLMILRLWGLVGEFGPKLILLWAPSKVRVVSPTGTVSEWIWIIGWPFKGCIRVFKDSLLS